MNIGIIGIGCVGSAILKDFKEKNIDVFIYDKYKNGGCGSLIDILSCKIIFLCLPTPYLKSTKEYDKRSILEVCSLLELDNYNGILVIKSTIEPETTYNLSKMFNLNFIHNPEFLSSSSAYDDFKNQKHIVLGYPNNLDKSTIQPLVKFYNNYYPDAEISIINSTESELMKLGVNNFYAVKIQFFNEIYLLSKKLDISFDIVRDTMIKNNWINPMHTIVPGNDGKLSYGGECFPKDTNELNQFMIKNNIPNGVLNSTINERNLFRNE